MLLLLDWSRIFDRHAKIDILDLLGEDDTMEVSVVFVSRAAGLHFLMHSTAH